MEVMQMECREQIKTCFFIGHRDAPEELRPRLQEAVERHIVQYGVTEFVAGHYGRFDAMSAAAVRAAKAAHPEISLVLLLPYYPFKGIRELSGDYDATFYPPGMEQAPKPFAIERANRYMIRHSDYLICYCMGYVGNTRKLVQQALARERKGLMRVENVVNAWPE